MWYMVIPVAAMIFFTRKTVIISIVCIFLLFCSVFLVISFIPIEYFSVDRPTDNQFMVINIFTILFSLSLIFFFVYYVSKVNYLRDLKIKQYQLAGIPEKDDKDIDKYDIIYNEILNHFSEKSPFCDPDFTISELAKSLNTNVKYISKAISMNCDANFNTFVNTYRINLVKDMLNKGYQNRYTIRYIYTYVGFRNQSTFNKAFKQVVDVTPSEYIKGINKRKIDLDTELINNKQN